MCDFEDQDLISCYTRKQAIKDGVLNEVMVWKGKHIVSTIGINHDFDLTGILTIFQRFIDWKKKVEPTLPEEDKLFSTNTKKGKVWIVEDSEAYTVMYPTEY